MDNKALLLNYAKMAYRNLLKTKLVSAINITGLVIGFTAVLLMGMFVHDEMSYDHHFKNNDRIYRITSAHSGQVRDYRSAQTTADLAPLLLSELPELEAATRMLPADEGFFFSEETAFKEKIIFTDSSFLKVFQLNLLVGNEKTCLKYPSSIIISEETAEKLFGREWRRKQILGKSLSIDGKIPIRITGVFPNFPDQTHFRTNLLATVPSGMSWMSDGPAYTYVLLHANTNAPSLQRKINSVQGERRIGKDRRYSIAELQPLSDIYLFSSLENENAQQGNIKNIYALIVASLFLLCITVINFANLYTATSVNRFKETGVRKTMGARSGQLRLQFLSETTLTTFLALGTAIFLSIALIPAFNDLTGKNVSPAFFMDGKVSGFVIGLGICIALLAGLYPSVYLTKENTIAALKGEKVKARGRIGLRGGFIAVQFALSCVMIILSIVAYRQIGLINHRPLGFDKNNTIALSNPYMLGSIERILSFRAGLLALPGVEQVSITGYTPSQTRWGNYRATFPGRDPLSAYQQQARWLTVDENFIETMGLTLLSGRNFYENHERDKQSVIVNEKALEEFQLNHNGNSASGSELSVQDGSAETFETYSVVGVVANFNFGSLHESIQPVIMKLGYHRFEMAVRLSPPYEHQTTIKKIEAAWKERLPVIPFEYSFIKTRFEQLHKSDIAAANIFTLFCLLTIVMSALGLFSIVRFSFAHRTKEIGIRKLLGATANNIVLLVAQDFLKVVAAGYVIALPVASMLAYRWIADFSYKTEISWWIFAAAAVILITVTILTLGYESMKASMANPIENLRHE